MPSKTIEQLKVAKLEFQREVSYYIQDKLLQFNDENGITIDAIDVHLVTPEVFGDDSPCAMVLSVDSSIKIFD